MNLPTPTPTPYPISIYPETWVSANRTLEQAFGIGFDDIAIGFAILILIGTALTLVIRKIKRGDL